MTEDSSEDSGEEDETPSTSDGERYVDLVDTLEELEATPIDQRLQFLETSFYIVQRNFEQMMGGLEFYQEADELWEMKNRPALDQFQQEFLRLVHNYIASYFSLYEHTQRIKNHVGSEELENQYEDKLDETGIEEISSFLLRFRAYTQHYQLPPLVAKLEYETIDRETGEGVERRHLVFDRDSLLEWDDWGDSRSYVEEFDEHVDFLDIAEEYQEKIREFTDWFDQAVREVYAEEFSELESVKAELNEITRETLDDETLEAWDMGSGNESLPEDEYFVYSGGGNVRTGTRSQHVGPVEIVSETSDDYPLFVINLDEDFYHDRFDGDYIGIKLCLVGKLGGQWKLGGLFEGTDEIAFILHQFDEAERLLNWIDESGALACVYNFEGVNIHEDAEYDHYERNFYDDEELEMIIADYLDLIRSPVEVTLDTD